MSKLAQAKMGVKRGMPAKGGAKGTMPTKGAAKKKY